MSLRPGSTVKHILRHAEHDEWKGIVVEIVDRRRIGSKERDVFVRWIEPGGNPSSSPTRHDAQELIEIGIGKPDKPPPARLAAGHLD